MGNWLLGDVAGEEEGEKVGKGEVDLEGCSSMWLERVRVNWLFYRQHEPSDAVTHPRIAISVPYLPSRKAIGPSRRSRSRYSSKSTRGSTSTYHPEHARRRSSSGIRLRSAQVCRGRGPFTSRLGRCTGLGIWIGAYCRCACRRWTEGRDGLRTAGLLWRAEGHVERPTNSSWSRGIRTVSSIECQGENERAGSTCAVENDSAAGQTRTGNSFELRSIRVERETVVVVSYRIALPLLGDDFGAGNSSCRCEGVSTNLGLGCVYDEKSAEEREREG